MKKFKLMLVAFMAMVGVNAFAADTDITGTVTVSGTAGLIYSPVVDGKAPLKYTITKVMDNNGDGTFKEGYVSVQENGTEMKTIASITIPATISIPIKIGAVESTQSFKVSEVVAFTAANSNALASVTFGSNVTKIDANAFDGVATLATVTFGGAEEEIGNNAFRGTIISALTLPGTLKTIGDGAFTAAAGKFPTFSTLAIPATVTSIGVAAFEGCENLATVTLAANSWLKTIGISAFAYTSLTELNLSNATANDNGTAADPSDDGMLAFGTAAASYGPFTSATHPNTSLVTKVVLPTTCVTIEKSAFKNVQYLAEIDLKNVKTINQDAFNGCKNLTAVAIGTTLADDDATGIAIATDAFSGCAKLATVELGTINVGLIADDAFGSAANVAAVETFKFNAIATAIGAVAFDLATVKTLYFQKYLAVDDLIPTNAFADNAFDATADETDYHIYYNVTKPSTVVGDAALAFEDDAFGAAAADRIITLHTSEDIQTAYGNANAINKVTISGDFSGAFTIGKGEEGSKVLIKDKNSSNYYYYFNATANTKIAKEQESGADVSIYQAYFDVVDDALNIYFMPLQVANGFYGILNGQTIIIKSNKEDAVEAAPLGAADITMIKDYAGNVLNKLQITAGVMSKLAVMSNASYLNNGANDVWFFNNPESSGFGFTKYNSAKQSGLAANCVNMQTPVTAAARVNIIWLDESNTTAIQNIQAKAATQNGVIYNVAGQKVSASYKGLVIKDGKKYIQK